MRHHVQLGKGKYKCGFLGFVFAKKKLPKMPRQNQEKIRFVGEQLLFRSDRDQRARCEAAEFVLVHFPDCVELATRQTAILQQYVALGRSPQTGDALTAGLRPREKRAQILPDRKSTRLNSSHT